MCRSLAVLAGLIVSPLHAKDGPYTPASPDVVLERLPATFAADIEPEVRALQRKLAERPDDVTAATQLAFRYLAQGKVASDPRYYGYAQAVLSPWWTAEAPPPTVRLLRATLAQRQHNFAAAVDDLKALVRHNSRHSQAWLLLANTYLVQGYTARAGAACAALAKVAHSSTSTLCYAAVMNRTGQAAKAWQLLDRLADRYREQPGATLQWILTTQAESAVLLGRTGQAEAAFTRALAIEHRDAYLLGAYSDFLLDQGRDREVLALLENQTSDPALLLRAAIAAKNTGDGKLADTWREQLRARFAAESRRGSRLHNREAALFQLKLEDNPQRALQLAIANWAVQKEPLDARILVEAAMAARRSTDLERVSVWLQVTGMQDTRLQRLLEQGEAG